MKGCICGVASIVIQSASACSCSLDCYMFQARARWSTVRMCAALLCLRSACVQHVGMNVCAHMLPVACVNPLEIFLPATAAQIISSGTGVSHISKLLESQRGRSPRWAGSGAGGLAVVVALSRWLRTAGGSDTGERGFRTPRDPSSRYIGAVLSKPARGPLLVANPR